MANLWVTEFENLAQIPNQGPQMVDVSQAITGYSVAIGAGSVQSAAFQPTTRVLWINTDTACLIAVGANPDASTSFFRLSAQQSVAVAVKLGAGHKIAAIQSP